MKFFEKACISICSILLSYGYSRFLHQQLKRLFVEYFILGRKRGNLYCAKFPILSKDQMKQEKLERYPKPSNPFQKMYESPFSSLLSSFPKPLHTVLEGLFSINDRNAKSKPNIHENLASAVGNTPVIYLPCLSISLSFECKRTVRIFAKLENRNVAAASSKDRLAAAFYSKRCLNADSGKYY